MPRAVLLTLTALLALGACTTSDTDGGLEPDPRPSASRTASDAPKGPDCATIWKAGRTLPKDYSSCVRGDRAGEQEVTRCRSGAPLVVFEDTLFARPGGRIVEPKDEPMQDGPEYAKAYSACTGE